MHTVPESGRIERMSKTYRYELHMHTAESSWCGRTPGARAAEMYAAAGYDGVCVTDHYFREAVESLPGRKAKDKVSAWLAGYRAVRDAGTRVGLETLLCMELRFDENFNDYLVYGITEELLMRHPDLYAMTPAAFYRFARQHGLFFAQAHPYRSVCVPADPACLHGIEVFNAHRRHQNHNDLAEALAAAHPHLVRLAGSDFHQENDLGGASVLFGERMRESAEIAGALLENRMVERCTGTWVFPMEK
jgi:hypothetical protein